MFSSLRLDYSKTYVIDHNVKVFDFGSIHDSSLQAFTKSWIQVSSSLKRREDLKEDLSKGRSKKKRQTRENESKNGSSSAAHVLRATAISDWDAAGYDNGLPIQKGECFVILEDLNEDWLTVYSDVTKREGWVPKSYVVLDSGG
jgi:hypothetical protein